MEVNLYTKIFFVALILRSATKSYLNYRNITNIKKHFNKVPKEFEDHITLEEHQKSANYTIDKIKASRFFALQDLVLLIIFTLLGGIDLISIYSMSFSFGPIITGLIFFLIIGFISTIFTLPQSIYSTFVIEAKYGFNKTDLKTFISDFIKGGILSIILGGIFLSIILYVMEAFPDYWWLIGFVALSALQLLLIYIFPTFIAPLFNKFSPLEEGELKTIILNLLNKIEFESSGIFVMDASKRSSHGNAYFTGFGKSKRIVFFDTLINSLNKNEIESVLAHELGHMKLNHIKKNILKAFVFSFIGFFILSVLKNNISFINGHGVSFTSNHSILALFMYIAGVYTFFITPFSSYSSRKHEFEADAFAAKYANASDLISGLIKMYKDNASSLTPDELYSKFYYSHPPALERINFLKDLINKKVSQ